MNTKGTTKSLRARRAADVLGRSAVAVAMVLALAGGGVAAEAAKINVNNASVEELATLPGIGASKAAAIVAEREKKPFASIADLERVRGIGAKTVEDLQDKVTAGGGR